MVTHASVPGPPQVTLTSQSTDSIIFALRPEDNPTSPILGFIVHYKGQYGFWEEEEKIGLDIDQFTLDDLECGCGYQYYAVAYNS